MYMSTHPEYGNIYNNGLPMALIHHIKIGFTCKKVYKIHGKVLVCITEP